MKIAVVTDSGSGIIPNEIQDENLYIIGMPFMINGEEYFEDINITKKEFFDKIDKDSNLSTSQPSVYVVEELWNKILQEYDQIIHIPLSSGLSASFEQANRLAKEKYSGKVFVVNNNRVSVTQRASVMDALNMIEAQIQAPDIQAYLESTKQDSSIYIMINDLTLLKKGGRITPQAQALAGLFHIKPILQIQGGKLDAYKKVISESVAKKVLLKAIQNDLDTRFKEYYEAGEMEIGVAHSDYLSQANILKEEIVRRFPLAKVRFVDYLSCLISCHTGPFALGIGCYRVFNNKK